MKERSRGAAVSSVAPGDGPDAQPRSEAVLSHGGLKDSSLPRVCPVCQSRYPADFNVCPRDATPLDQAADEADPLLGATLGDAYQMIRVIGEGGMGRVYEARHTRLSNKRFAIKLLHPEYARQADVVARFQREAETASGINHPNVVDVYDVHRTNDGRPYLVGEFLEGQELGELLKVEAVLSLRLTVHIARQLCSALAAAHARGVVHRDMKPENIFLVGDPAFPTVKVIDFGISKVGDATGTALTRTGMIMGTPSYMAPEQARGDNIDQRADVYAVGGILYRCLTGKKPFDGDDPAVVLTAVLTGDPPRPSSIVSSIPAELELIIQRAMSKRVEERYASMAELDAELAHFAAHFAFPEGSSLESVAPMGDGALSDPGSYGNLAAARSPALGLARSNQNRNARRARPTIVVMTMLAYSWLLGGLIDAINGAVRVFRPGGGSLTRTEGILIAVGALATTLTPFLLWVRHLSRNWGNTVRAIDLADLMRKVTLIAIASSGGGALCLRLLLGARQDETLAFSPMWSLHLFVLSLLGGFLAYMSYRAERRR